MVRLILLKREENTKKLNVRNVAKYYFPKNKDYNVEDRSFIDEVLILPPMESIEFIIESPEKNGGAGANCIVSYSAKAEFNNLPYNEIDYFINFSCMSI